MNRLPTLSKIVEELNLPKFRFDQILTAIFDHQTQGYNHISTLPKELKARLVLELGENIVSLTKIHEVKGDHAHKILFETRDHHMVESVRLTYKTHNALCVSTQSGCALGCKFCATGAVGFKKNLTADEIVDQLLYFQKNTLPIDRIIFMGMGEPFSNPLNTLEALKQLTNPKMAGLSPRRLSISTVGIIPGIEQLTRDFPNVNLAFSLHSPFPEQRGEMMPITKAYPIDKVMTAIDRHLEVTNHKVFVSYILLDHTNDTPEHAQALSRLINASPTRRRLLHVNLIRFNPGPTIEKYTKATPERVRAFQTILEENEVKNTLRQDFGVKIDAACGQLYAKYLPKNNL